MLDSINNFNQKKLKKVETNDRSAPVVSNTNNGNDIIFNKLYGEIMIYHLINRTIGFVID